MVVVMVPAMVRAAVGAGDGDATVRRDDDAKVTTGDARAGGRAGGGDGRSVWTSGQVFWWWLPSRPVNVVVVVVVAVDRRMADDDDETLGVVRSISFRRFRFVSLSAPPSSPVWPVQR